MGRNSNVPVGDRAPRKNLNNADRQLVAAAKKKGVDAFENKFSDTVNGRPQVDHRVPIAKGGTNSPSNKQVLRADVNRKKGAKSNTRAKLAMQCPSDDEFDDVTARIAGIRL
jgi:5-methylcytosine-specific restriction endonuclease McrA